MIKEMYQHETVFYSFICITYFLSMNSWLMRRGTKCIWLTKEEKCVIFAPKSVIIVVSVFRLSHAMNYTLPLERNNNDMIFGTSVDMYSCLKNISLFVFIQTHCLKYHHDKWGIFVSCIINYKKHVFLLFVNTITLKSLLEYSIQS